MLTTTLRLLREHRACEDHCGVLALALGPGWGDDDPIPILRILETNGLDDALLALGAVPPEQKPERDRVARLLACDFAERAVPHYGAVFPGDDRSREYLQTSRRYARGEATAEELEAAKWDARRRHGGAFEADWILWDAAWALGALVKAIEGDPWGAAVEVRRVVAGRAERLWQTERLRDALEVTP